MLRYTHTAYLDLISSSFYA